MAAEDLFAQFFGGGGFGGMGGMFGGGGMNRGPPKARTIHHTHKVSLEDIYRGKISKLALQRSIICPKCDGLGGKEGAVKRCAGCDGHGMKTMMRQMGPMIQRFQTVCPDCNGEGESIKEKDRCKQCNGKKTTVDRMLIRVSAVAPRSSSEARVTKHLVFRPATSFSKSSRSPILASPAERMISFTTAILSL